MHVNLEFNLKEQKGIWLNSIVKIKVNVRNKISILATDVVLQFARI